MNHPNQPPRTPGHDCTRQALAWGPHPVWRIVLALLAHAGITLTAGHAAAQSPAVVAEAEQPPAEEELGVKWIRLTQDAQGRPAGLDTCIVRYTGKFNGRPVTVDLVGAVHVGDHAYYQLLNQRFKGYDAVLYELVAPEGKNIPKQTREGRWNPLGALQTGMQTVLALEHQLEQIDYTQLNFVHADMSPQEFFATMKERGESVLSMVWRAVNETAAAGNNEEAADMAAQANAELLIAMFSKNRARRLKIAMARQFDQMEFLMASFGGEEGSTLIEERNKKALEVLRRELNAGKSRLSIFYGAGHLADMHERLVGEFGMQPQSIEWITAWDLSEE